MAARVGTCGGCSSRFRIPDSFAGDRAKCRKCGGIIEIAPEVPAVAPAFVAERETDEDREPEPRAERAADFTTSEATAFTFTSFSNRPAPAAEESTPEPDAEEPPAAEAVEPMPAPTPAPRLASAPPRPPSPIVRPKPASRRAKSEYVENTPKAAPAPASRAAHGHEKRRLLIGGGIAFLLVVGGVAYLYSSSQDDGDPSANDRSAALAPTASPSKATAEKPSDEPRTSVAPEAAATPDAEDAAANPAAEPVPTKFEFVGLERSPGTTDEEWDRMRELAAKLHEGGKPRKLALKELLRFGIKAVPVLVNSVNGIDLSKYSQWVDGAEVSRFIQDDLLAETILIPYHGAFSTDPKEVRHNQVVLKSMVDYWNAQVNDPSRWGALLQKYEEKRSTRGNQHRDADGE